MTTDPRTRLHRSGAARKELAGRGACALTGVGTGYLFVVIGLRSLAGAICASGGCLDPTPCDGGWQAIAVAVAVASTATLMVAIPSPGDERSRAHRLVLVAACFALVMFSVPMLG